MFGETTRLQGRRVSEKEQKLRSTMKEMCESLEREADGSKLSVMIQQRRALLASTSRQTTRDVLMHLDRVANIKIGRQRDPD